MVEPAFDKTANAMRLLLIQSTSAYVLAQWVRKELVVRHPFSFLVSVLLLQTATKLQLGSTPLLR